jgi:hypothetical protein
MTRHLRSLVLARPALVLFVVVAGVYLAAAGRRALSPSPQFHFVDLAQSFLDGRLDTDTPKRRSADIDPATSPQGYREAIARTEAAGGWNDWSSLRQLTLSDGQVVVGHFPWAHERDKSARANLFHTRDGREFRIDLARDVARTCGPSGRGLCDSRVYHVSFPPFPAVLVTPLVALFGYNVNDVLLTALLGGLNAVLLFWFLELLVRRGHSRRESGENFVLALAFAFGTVAFFSSVRGEVWFSALIVGVALNLGFMMASLDLRYPALAGLLLGLGFATRTPILFCGIFFGWQLLMPDNTFSREDLRRRLGIALRFALPLVAVLAALGAYNAARFGDPGEFGHAFLSGGAGDRVRSYGMFSFAYLNRNLLSALVAMPRLMAEAPYVMVSNHGLGMLATTPFLFLLLWPVERRPLRVALWLAVACAAVPGLFYQNTGWVQFGFRFALDYLPYLFALLAISGRKLDRTFYLLLAVAILVNLFGAITFGRHPQFYYETLLPGAT